MYRRKDFALLLAKTCIPFLPQCLRAQGFAFLFTTLGTEFGLTAGIGNPFLLRQFLNKGSTPREPPQYVSRYSADLEIITLSLDAKSLVLKFVGQPHPKRCLKVRGIPLEFPKLTGFPSLFFLIPGGVEHKDVGV